ncbi:head maturation protease, ClpP-related [Nocardioides jensenii]|uniref:head maturation protease, ClpP-related n=1 Tax=Nocardioides jensenii TaxID=1843 RepID=UPI000830AEF0|nr:head maturation protease, ClpP-related [Nocardioides jensenii]
MSKPTDRLRQIQASKSRICRAVGLRSIRAEVGASDEGTTRGELWLYGVVGGWWYGFDAESVSHELRGLDVDEITVRVHSPGGNAIDGIAIGNLLRNHRARITVVVDGMAASAASVLALGGDEIVMSPGSQFMIHDASVMTYGNAAQLRADADWIDKQSQNYAAVYASRAGGTAEQWREAMTADNGEGTWYTAEESVSAGLADRIGTVTAAGSPPVAPVDQLDDEDEMAALAAWDLDVLVHPAARAAWQTPKPPIASASGKTETEGGSAVALTTEQITMRQKLGIAEDADEATVVAALTEALAERAEPTAETTVPEGHVVIPAAKLADLEAGAKLATTTAKALHDQERKTFLDSVKGKYLPTSREGWEAEYDRDSEGVKAHFEKAAVLIPTSEIGHDAPVDEAKSEDDAIYALVFGDDEKEA